MTQLVPSLTVTDRMLVRRVRELPVPGKALKAVGDLVEPSTLVCHGEIPGEIVVVSPADELGLTPELVKNSYLVTVGQSVTQGTVLVRVSYFFGLIKSAVVSPIDGKITFITEEHGRIGIQMPSTVAERIAYCGGRVVAIGDDGVVELESEVSLVQGIFGVGGERVGTIRMLSCALDSIVGVGDFPEDCTGAILVGGMAPDLGTLQEAARRGAVGFVCGSVSAKILQEFVGDDIGVAVTGDEAVSMSLVVTEGFGAIPMSPRAHAVLAARADCVAGINGTTQVRAGAVRPEILVSYSSDATEGSQVKSAPLELPELKLGSRIRLIRYPHFGRFGTVTSLPDELREIETGALVRVLSAKLDDGEEVIVPRANIELLA